MLSQSFLKFVHPRKIVHDISRAKIIVQIFILCIDARKEKFIHFLALSFVHFFTFLGAGDSFLLVLAPAKM
jgi:hypothetical protein